jgi:hypothetical protein
MRRENAGIIVRFIPSRELVISAAGCYDAQTVYLIVFGDLSRRNGSHSVQLHLLALAVVDWLLAPIPATAVSLLHNGDRWLYLNRGMKARQALSVKIHNATEDLGSSRRSISP